MVVNDYPVGLASENEVYIQTNPVSLVRTDGKVFLTRGEIQLLLGMLSPDRQENATVKAAG